jgi:hypothetical protein
MNLVNFTNTAFARNLSQYYFCGPPPNSIESWHKLRLRFKLFDRLFRLLIICPLHNFSSLSGSGFSILKLIHSRSERAEVIVARQKILSDEELATSLDQ